MEKCPKCGSTLNVDEKASGQCFSCNAWFETELTQKKDKVRSFNSSTSSNVSSENVIAKAIKICGYIMLVRGTIGSFVLGSKDSLVMFFTYEIAVIISVLFFLGFAEIIQLLEDIKRK